MSQLSPAERANLPVPHLFVLFRPPVDWVVPAHTGKSNLLYQSTDSNANLIQKHSPGECRSHRDTQK